MQADDPRRDARSLLRTVRIDPIEQQHLRDLLDLLEDSTADFQRLGLTGLRTVAARKPDLMVAECDPELSRLRTLCTSDDPSVRAGAATTLGKAWSIGLGLAEDILDAVIPLLDDDEKLVRSKALGTVRTVGLGAPSKLVPLVDQLEPSLDAAGTDRESAVSIIAIVASEDGKRAATQLPALLDVFEDANSSAGSMPAPDIKTEQYQPLRDRLQEQSADAMAAHRTVRTISGHAIVEIAADHPEAVKPYANRIAARLDDDDPQVRHVATDVLVVLGEHDPTLVADHAEGLANLLTPAEASFVTHSAIRALATATIAEPTNVGSALSDHVESITPALRNDEPTVRGAAATLVAVVAERDPSIVKAARRDLERLAEDDIDYVREAATDALEQTN